MNESEKSEDEDEDVNYAVFSESGDLPPHGNYAFSKIKKMIKKKIEKKMLRYNNLSKLYSNLLNSKSHFVWATDGYTSLDSLQTVPPDKVSQFRSQIRCSEQIPISYITVLLDLLVEHKAQEKEMSYDDRKAILDDLESQIKLIGSNPINQLNILLAIVT